MLSESEEDYALLREAEAWAWLLGLERVGRQDSTFRQFTQQIIIRACPGKLARQENFGIPYVSVSVEIPGIKGRTVESGNCLAAAVSRLYFVLLKKGAELPDLPRSVGTAM